MSDLQVVLGQLKNEKDLFKKAKLILSLKENKMPVNLISRELNLKPSYVSHILRLNKLPELIVDGYYSGAISVSHLFIISRLLREEDMIEVYEQSLSENLPALQTEELVRQKLHNVKNEGKHLSSDEVDRLNETMTQLGVEAKLVQTRIKSKLILEVKGNLSKTSEIFRKIIDLLQGKNSQVGER